MRITAFMLLSFLSITTLNFPAFAAGEKRTASEREDRGVVLRPHQREAHTQEFPRTGTACGAMGYQPDYRLANASQRESGVSIGESPMSFLVRTTERNTGSYGLSPPTPFPTMRFDTY